MNTQAYNKAKNELNYKMQTRLDELLKTDVILKALKKEKIALKKQFDNTQKMCIHDLKYDGSYHDDDYYKCTLCGAIVRS